MARPSSGFHVAWSSLSGNDELPGWRSISLEPAGLVAIHAGRRFPGNDEAVLFAFPSATPPVGEKLPDGQGFLVERADPRGDSATWLALTRKAYGNIDMFTTMVGDVVDSLDVAVADGRDEHQLLRVFLRRVRAWQEFMRKGTQGLSPEAEIGLIGELQVLANILEAGVSGHTALESWIGPLDGLQDFEIGMGAIEVKSTLATSGFPARIGSLDQLDDAIRQPLFVVGVKLRQFTEGRNLPDVIADLRQSISNDKEAQRMLSDRLLSGGYFDAHADYYTRRFDAVGMRVIEVTPTFPRLLHATIPKGVTSAIYGIDLDQADGPELDLTGALKRLGAI